MTRRSVLWAVGAALYTFINVGGAFYALAMREPRHAAVHVVLLVVGVMVWSRRASARAVRVAEQGDWAGEHADGELTDRFRNLERSIDAVAIEVARIGEGQRVMTDLLVDHEDPPASGIQAPRPPDTERKWSS